MLKLSGKRLIGEMSEKIDNELKITYLPNDKEYYLITGGKPYLLNKDDTFLIWDIPEDIDKSEIKIKIQAIDPIKRNVQYVTNEILLRTTTTVKSFNDGQSIKALTTTSMYTYDSDYPFYNMIDEHLVIPVIGREIKMPQDYVIVISRDNASQLLTFETNRYFDGVDRAKKACCISYKNAKDEDGKAIVVNVRYSDDKLIFSWLLNENVTIQHGIVKFKVEFLGYNEFDQTYIWQSLPATLNVEEGLWVDDNEVVDRYPNIIEDLQIQIKFLGSLLDGEGGNINDNIFVKMLEFESKLNELQEGIDGSEPGFGSF